MKRAALAAIFVVSTSLSACVMGKTRPCTDGGQPPHDDGKAGTGTRQCIQVKDATGRFVNQGKYREWYPSGQRSLEGEYAGGLKTGKWTEWDEQGRKISEKWYEEGNEVPGREAVPYNGLTRPPRKAAAASPAPQP